MTPPSPASAANGAPASPPVIPFPPNVAVRALTRLLHAGVLGHVEVKQLLEDPELDDAALAQLVTVHGLARRLLVQSARTLGPLTITALLASRDLEAAYLLAANPALTSQSAAIPLAFLTKNPAGNVPLLAGLLENPGAPLAALLPLLPHAHAAALSPHDRARMAEGLARRVATDHAHLPDGLLHTVAARCLAAEDAWLRQVAVLTLVPLLDAPAPLPPPHNAAALRPGRAPGVWQQI